jgi:hypothetical protein
MDCERFEDVLLELPLSATTLGTDDAEAHVVACNTCRKQWLAHVALARTFAAERVPEPSHAAAVQLERRLGAAAAVRPLRGWRLAALVAYGVFAVVVLRLALVGVPIPSVDWSTWWGRVSVLAAVPVSLLLAAAVSRWIPARGLPSAALLRSE